MNYKLLNVTDLNGNEKIPTLATGKVLINEECEIVGAFTLDVEFELEFKEGNLKDSKIHAITESNIQLVVVTDEYVYTLERKMEDK
ncbi:MULTISPECIES: hypothetical protein [unclassified Breznakia]|uniref:hypothetical protein n=1 Tax=unclassified Breznakia TaxID=2623764 RepID=UPI0024739E2C|nr:MULTISPECIES: hypothetical protein [unclassified Breznakia]MDH6367540.1 hypothetical protein [Breznakia sp. PH1-1]MDH6404666.1 hypothetical protein [Breznakia sp. PF1-11]MDH6412370.1 hypothetical protein [Breznakia sp. PFB1-11]MDH6414708.1 hypothetical protein [Breznakia sp. PFB1-14]MDH6417047.1 hypothetical protein [Breznakia sp. PFB1-4]